MKTYETSATVEDQGDVRVAGVPFAPGTEVAVMIREKVAGDAGHGPANGEEARAHMKDLFGRVRAHATETVRPLRARNYMTAKFFVDHDDAVVLLQSLARIPVCPLTRELVMEAVDLRYRCQISYWDAAIIAAAKQMGCQTLFSEDLNPGQVYDGVTVVNPFTSVTP